MQMNYVSQSEFDALERKVTTLENNIKDIKSVLKTIKNIFSIEKLNLENTGVSPSTISVLDAGIKAIDSLS